MKAILINPFEKTITEVDYNGKFEQAYKLMDCSMIEYVRPIKGHTLLLDEDGMFKAKQAKFRLFGNPVQFINCALLVGGLRGNKSTDLSVDAVRSLVQFL